MEPMSILGDTSPSPPVRPAPAASGSVASDLDARIAERVRELRAERGLSLDSLAARSGVSRSMLSLVERGESNPTAVLLERIATGLGVTLASLFDAPAGEGSSEGPVSRREDQAVWRDPASGYSRRNVSPRGTLQPMQIVEIRFPAGARVAFETGARNEIVHQQVWVLAGAIDVTLGEERHSLGTGDCLAMRLDRPTMFHNPTRRAARYAVVIASEAPPRR